MGLIIVIASSRLIDLLICAYLRKSVVDDCIDWGIYAVCPTSSVNPISGRNYAPLHDSPKQQPYAIACGAIRGKPLTEIGSGGED